jgi:hypothetical protein
MRLRAIPVLLLVALALAPAGAMADESASLAGDYDGSRPEIGARLQLSPDGTYRYFLSYGALDEYSEGSWVADGECAVLTSEPVTPPEIRLVEGGLLESRALWVELQVPEGVDPAYFEVVFVHGDGTGEVESLAGGTAEFEIGADEDLVEVMVELPLFGVSSQPVPFPKEGGIDLTFAFDPNDLGKVGFDGERLCPRGGGLHLTRGDIALTFRRDEE